MAKTMHREPKEPKDVINNNNNSSSATLNSGVSVYQLLCEVLPMHHAV